mgnify:CR=1 FL=1
MVDKAHFKDLVTYTLIIGLFVLAFLIIKPIILSIIYGVLLAYIVFPAYKLLSKRIKNNTIAASLFCILVLVIISLLAFLFFQFSFRQVIDFYLYLQKVDIVPIIKSIIPNYISPDISTKITTSISSALSSFIASFLEDITNLIVNITTAFLHLSIVIFVFFFALRDGEKAIAYIKSLSPLKKETEDRFFKQFRDITNSVLLGHIVIGVAQGIIAGIGYFIFGVPNAALLTLLTVIVAIIPIIGPWLVWVPVDVYLFISGNTGAAIGFLIYGTILISTLDNFIKPFIVSRGTEVNSLIIFIGMIGGLFAFGLLGIIIGPLVLAYVLLLAELYRKHAMAEDLIFKKPEAH